MFRQVSLDACYTSEISVPSTSFCNPEDSKTITKDVE